MTTDVPGCRQAIVPNVTGILVPVKDSTKLADAIKYLIDNPKREFLWVELEENLLKKNFQLKKLFKIILKFTKIFLVIRKIFTKQCFKN